MLSTHYPEMHTSLSSFSIRGKQRPEIFLRNAQGNTEGSRAGIQPQSLQEMGIPDHLTCLLRNLYAGQEAIVRTGHETMDWFQIGKGVHQGCILSSCLFNFYAEYIMSNARLDEAHWNQDFQEKYQ